MVTLLLILIILWYPKGYVYGRSTRWLLPHQYGLKRAPIYGPRMEQEGIYIYIFIYYVFLVLPFGLAISTLVFSKTMRAIITHLRHGRFYRSRKKREQFSKEKISQIALEIRPAYLCGKVKFKTRADKRVSRPQYRYTRKTNVFRTTEKKR